jgi:hypothetical protein
MSYFKKRRHSAGDWETKFNQAKMAKYGGGPSVSSRAEVKMEKESATVPDYMPTPKKPRTSGGETDPSSSRWTNLPSMETVYFQPVRTIEEGPPAPHPVINLQAIGENFDILEETLPRMAGYSAALLAELRENFGKLAAALQKMDRQLGHPEGFGIMASVTTAFDGLRYLHEIGEERNVKFEKYPYE